MNFKSWLPKLTFRKSAFRWFFVIVCSIVSMFSVVNLWAAPSFNPDAKGVVRTLRLESTNRSQPVYAPVGALHELIFFIINDDTLHSKPNFTFATQIQNENVPENTRVAGPII